jgi:mRNA-degrading endonuclease YafQ of YafQ-DinJ toxin-antitoxin module
MPSAPRARSVVQAPRFARAKRAFPAPVQLQIDEIVKAIMADPLVGEPKTGALKGVRVEKFKVGPQQLLLAYTFTAKTQTLEMLDVGPHENFYRGLTQYLDARPGPGG